MAYRFTNTDKWADSWFANLKPIEKLLFIYLYENCDIAGFIEINLKRWAVDIGAELKTIEGALKGLDRGIIFSKDKDCLYIRNFLKHQKNYPLAENNRAHQGILKRFIIYRHKFDIEDINEFIERGFEGALKGLNSPYGIGNGNGNGIGNGIGNGNGKGEPKKKKYAEYVSLTEEEYQKLCDEHTQGNADLFIQILNNYKGAKGKTYKSDYLAILNWVIEKTKADGSYFKNKPRVVR